ncbi:MAG: radical SAM protein, partial [Blastocatellia bacterium]
MNHAVDSITLLTTYDCNAACDHCYYHSKPGKTGHMTPEEAESYFDAIINEWGKLASVKILGGEPFMYYKPLLEIIRMASRRGAQVVLLTNGVWGGSDGLADRVAREFKEAGLTAAVIGASGFHAPYVAPESAVRAAKAARKHGVQVVMANYVLNGIEEENEYDVESRRLLEMCKA